jgi:hypothetical protein
MDVMEETVLSKEEKACLQMWFRQAIAKIETEEALRSLMREHAADNAARSGHPSISVRRAPRSRLARIVKQLV